MTLSSQVSSEDVRVKDTGKWKVGDCLLADFSMKFHLNINRTVLNITSDYEVPASAEVVRDPANCGNTTNILSLSWNEKAQNDTSTTLNRKITATFSKAQNASSPMYGMTKFVAVFEVGKFKNSTGNLTTSTIEMIYQAPKGHLVFQTPLDRSYTCKDVDFTNTNALNTTIRYNNVLVGGLNSTDVSATNVAFDAFRPKTSPTTFRTPMDCDYQPNDIIPIAVGVALAALVIAVLVAYVVGRNRQRQRGYQSV